MYISGPQLDKIGWPRKVNFDIGTNSSVALWGTSVNHVIVSGIKKKTNQSEKVSIISYGKIGLRYTASPLLQFGELQ